MTVTPATAAAVHFDTRQLPGDADAVGAARQATRQLLQDVDFPVFVSSLIEGTFESIVESTLATMVLMGIDRIVVTDAAITARIASASPSSTGA